MVSFVPLQMQRRTEAKSHSQLCQLTVVFQCQFTTVISLSRQDLSKKDGSGL